jgi:lipopolysaccharide transport system permease protein
MAEPDAGAATGHRPGELDWSQFDLVLQPPKGWAPLDLQALWDYRELLVFLAWRDIKVRYKQTVLGAAWAIVQPLFTMLVFSLFFGRLARMPSDGVPYPLFAFAGLVPWGFFAHGLNQAADSLVGSANLIKKVYFPRLILPMSGVLSGVVDFCLAFCVLAAMMAWFGIAPGVRVLWLPGFVLLAVVTALGVGLWLSALNVQFRDIRYTLTFLTQIWLFCTPIAYPSRLLREPWRSVYGLNPMVGVVEGFRWALLGTATPGPLIWVSAAAALATLVSGAFYFRRMERGFADTV